MRLNLAADLAQLVYGDFEKPYYFRIVLENLNDVDFGRRMTLGMFLSWGHWGSPR